MIVMIIKYAFYFAAGVIVVIISDKLAEKYYEKKYKANFIKKEK